MKNMNITPFGIGDVEIWFITGSQHLYGEETLKEVAVHSQEIVNDLNASKQISASIVFKPVVTTPEDILTVCKEANAAKNCIGIIYIRCKR